jgi:hypothetical protein
MRDLLDRHVVRDHERGRAEFVVHLRQRFEHEDAGLRIECARRLVAEQHLGALGDGAGDRHALLLAAGELRGEMIEPLPRPTIASASSGFSGLRAISVTRATFSRAVRLGTRL